MERHGTRRADFADAPLEQLVDAQDDAAATIVIIIIIITVITISTCTVLHAGIGLRGI